MIPEPLPDVVGDIKSAIEKEIKSYQPQSNWASTLGHPCARHLTYKRLDWDKLPKLTVEKRMLFDLGHVIERHVAKVYLEKAGYEIVEMGRPIQAETSGLLRRLKIAGYMDFIVRDPRTKFEFPVEVKGMSPNSWDNITCVEDMLMSKHYWMRQYPGQLMVYMLSNTGYELGMFLTINKVTAAPRAIWVHQDYTYAEELLKKAEVVNKSVDNNHYPDRIPYDDAICGACEFAPHCLKEIARTEAEILTEQSLIDDLEERESLKKGYARYKELDKSIKKNLTGIAKGIAGAFMIVGKMMKRSSYTVEETEYWQTSIKKLE